VNRLGWSSTSSKLQSTGRLNALRCGRFVEVANATACECVEDVPSDDPPGSRRARLRISLFLA